MSLVYFWGLGHANKQVAADGVSPVDAIGFTDSALPGISRNQNDVQYASFCPVGVTGLAADSFDVGKPSQRPYLVFRQNPGPASGSIAAYTIATGVFTSSALNCLTYSGSVYNCVFGVRMIWDYDGSASTVQNSNAVVIRATINGVVTTLMALNSATQLAVILGSGVAWPPKTEMYVEFKISTNNVITAQVNGVPLAVSLSVGGTTAVSLQIGFAGGTSFTLPNSRTGSGWGKLGVGDFYLLSMTAGAAPWINFLGPVKAVTLTPDTVVSNNMTTSPTAGADPLAAVTAANDGLSLATTDSASLAAFSFSQIPSGMGGKLMAFYPFMVTSKDSSYSQTMSLMEGVSGGSLTANLGISPATGKNSWSLKATPWITLPDGSTLSDATFPNYQFGIRSQ